MDTDDPLVQALPPATDYLTYCTLLEQQLTPERLPLLHQLLQDERLTTNIGWDIVKLLLPMLPASTECLHDVARLGNPREVILSVTDALNRIYIKLDNFDENTWSYGEEREATPAQIQQFNCLLAMLSVLHSRLQTRSPSKFIATSLEAILDAYNLMACDETTLAFLEFLRSVSPKKRPAPPPRAPSDTSVHRVSEQSAPDPEAEETSPSPAADKETAMVHRFLQFALLELLKGYLLKFESPGDPVMYWAVRMQEHLHPSLRIPDQSQTKAFATTKELKERDMIMGKIVALSRDLEFNDIVLWVIIGLPASKQIPLLEFHNLPDDPEDIPLERHGCLLLLAARAAAATIFASGHEIPMFPVFPDVAKIFSNFLGTVPNIDQVNYGQPPALLDALVTLAISAMQEPMGRPSGDGEFKRFVITLTGCTVRQNHGIVRQLPGTIVHNHPSREVRFNLIYETLKDTRLEFAWDSAISWLKQEILSTDSAATIFHDPCYFWALFPHLFHSVRIVVSKDLLNSWMLLTESQGAAVHSALNLYYLILMHESLGGRLHLEKTIPFFRNDVMIPLRKLLRDIEADLPSNGGAGLIEISVGEEMCALGNARSVGIIGLTLDQIEEVVNDVYGTDDRDLEGYSAEEEARVLEIRRSIESRRGGI